MRFSKVIMAVFCLALVPVMAGAVTINEIRIDQSGGDNDEYFELFGDEGESLDGLTYIVIGDGTGGSGVIEAVVDLAGLAIPADGHFLAVEASFSLDCADEPDLVTTLNFENSDNVTHMLVSDFTGAEGDDVDIDDDGNLDNPPWAGITDCVALVESTDEGELTYCGNSVGPDDIFVPGHVLVCEGLWIIGDFDICALDTPGLSNANACTVGTEETSFGTLKSMYR